MVKLAWQAERQALADLGRTLIGSGLSVGTYGNLSCRLDDTHVAITPSGKEYAALQAEDMVVINLAGEKTEGRWLPSSELYLHLEIYKNILEAQSVVHTHSLYATALAVAHKDLPPIVEDLTQLTGGSVRCTEYESPGTEALGKAAVAALEDRHAALLANHGAVCWGRTMYEALNAAVVLEKGAHIYCIAHGFGTPFRLEEKQAKKLRDFYEEHYSKRQRGEE